MFALQNENISIQEKLNYRRRSTREEIYKRLNSARDYMYSMYNQKITLADISRAACLNSHYMLREFKKFFNCTPYAYLTGIRMKEAIKLLLNSDKSITEISSITGFEFSSSFTHLFVKHFGTTPGKYRAGVTFK
jgi:AraC-like DNA-binding protein